MSPDLLAEQVWFEIYTSDLSAEVKGKRLQLGEF